MKSPSVVMLTLTILVFLTWVPMSLSCNKALCASDVSKCLIQVSSLGLYLPSGFSGLILVTVVSCWLIGGWLSWGGFRWTDLSMWTSPGLHMAAGQNSKRRSENTRTVFRPTLRTDTKSLPPDSVDQSKFQDDFHSRDLEIDPCLLIRGAAKKELCQCRPGEGNCSCCKECMLCLGTLWDECCDCVGMCNPRNYSDTPPTSKSTVEELHEPIPSLFRALTEGDTQLNWNIVSFPVAEELSHHENLVSFLETVNQPHHQNVSVPSNNVHAPYSSDKEHMCTVVYFDDCMSIHQCKISCESMGASKYRWFHNACCECIGPECIDYGSKTVKCMNCMF